MGRERRIILSDISHVIRFIWPSCTHIISHCLLPEEIAADGSLPRSHIRCLSRILNDCFILLDRVTQAPAANSACIGTWTSICMGIRPGAQAPVSGSTNNSAESYRLERREQ